MIEGLLWFGARAGLVKYDSYGISGIQRRLDQSDTSRGLSVPVVMGGVTKSRDGKDLEHRYRDGVITSYDPVMEDFSLLSIR